MPVYIQIFLADGRSDGSTRGSTRGPRGPKKYSNEYFCTNLFLFEAKLPFPSVCLLRTPVKEGAGERSDQAVHDIGGCWVAQLPFLCLTPSNWCILGKNREEGTKPKRTISTTEMFFDGWNSQRFIAAHFKTGVCKERR